MDFFDKIGKKASEAYKVTADKTGKIAREAKLKIKMNDLKGQVNELYQEIGKKVYEKHIREENIDIKKELEEECTKIDVLSAEVEEILKECMLLKDKKQCQKCYKEIEKEAKFCPECGEKQEEEVKDVEIIHNIEEGKSQEESNNEASENQENTSQEDEEEFSQEESKEELEKTVEIESNVDDE